MNYTSLGGTYEFLTGAQQGKQVFGQDPLWLAWVTDLINLKDAGNLTQYNELLSTVTPARFKSRTNDWFNRYLNGLDPRNVYQCG